MKQSNGISGKSGSDRPLLNPLDLATLFYVLFSAVYICIGLSHLQNVVPHMAIRVGVTGVVFGLAVLHRQFPNEFVAFFRNLYPLLLIGYFYTETSYLKNIIIPGNLDGSLSGIEAAVFGCQPSLCFSKAVPYKWFNELMNLCYFSYYLITTVVCMALYFLKRSESFRGVFVVIFSFYMYYVIYALLPVVGPQFYFSAADIEMERPYLFGKIMHYILTNAEEPTGAFPSSHVGMALILAWVAFKHLRKLFWFVLPLALGICFATVYLKAHYLLDVLAGIASVPSSFLSAIRLIHGSPESTGRLSPRGN